MVYQIINVFECESRMCDVESEHTPLILTGWILSLTTEPQHKSTGPGQEIQVDAMVYSKIQLLK